MMQSLKLIQNYAKTNEKDYYKKFNQESSSAVGTAHRTGLGLFYSPKYSYSHTYQNQINPVSGAGADISVGKKILALIATSANKKTNRIKNGPTFWRKKVITSSKPREGRRRINQL
jgi:hypothetical protein